MSAPPTDTTICPLGPIDPASIEDAEHEKAAPWIVRKLAGSMTGRIVMSSYETMKAAGTTVLCLSPWGDSSPLLLPCIRFRDLAVHMVIAGTGGVAAVAAPVMYPISDAIVTAIGDSIIIEIGMHTGFELTTKLADDLVIGHPIKHMIPVHSKRLETTAIKSMLITLPYKHLVGDAAIGFYRSSLHEDSSLFATVKDYLAIEKGWFSPYLFASGRRPIIPRSMKPDIIFCHGPFLSGDYEVGQAILRESALVISFATAPPKEPGAEHKDDDSTSKDKHEHHSRLKLSTYTHKVSSFSSQLPHLHSLSRSPSPNPSTSPDVAATSRTPSPPPTLTPLPPSPPRRLLITVIALKPHRAGLWTSSQRPNESVMYYQLLNGCPTVVVPVRLGAPLVAWDGMTLEEIWDVEIPDDESPVKGASAGAERKEENIGSFEGTVSVLFEFLDVCVEWDRVVLPKNSDGEVGATPDPDGDNSVNGSSSEAKKESLKDALRLLLAGAVRSGKSKEVRKEVDKERAGIAMWRIP